MLTMKISFFPISLSVTHLKKYALDRRNGWMVNQSDYVVTYVKNTRGVAHKFKEKAEKKKKTVINLYKEE